MQKQKQRVSDFLKTHFLINFGILFFPWKRYFIPFSTMFQYFNVATIGCAISFQSFDVSDKRWWECNIITTPNSYSILVFFFSTESDFLYLLIACFNVQMWPVLLLQFHFKLLMFSSARDGAVYHYFSPQFWFNVGVLFFYPWKLFFIPSRTMFQNANVASIGPTISFRVFDISFSRGWGSISLFLKPFLCLFGCSYMGLKGIVEGL